MRLVDCIPKFPSLREILANWVGLLVGFRMDVREAWWIATRQSQLITFSLFLLSNNTFNPAAQPEPFAVLGDAGLIPIMLYQ